MRAHTHTHTHTHTHCMHMHNACMTSKYAYIEYTIYICVVSRVHAVYQNICPYTRVYICMYMYMPNYPGIYVSAIQIEEESFLVRFYDSDVEEPSSMERLYVCLSDRFLEERNFGSAKVSTEFKIYHPLLHIYMLQVIDKLDLNCLQSATRQSLNNKTW